MEDVSTGLLEKIKNIQEVKIKQKHDMMYQDIYNCICQNTRKWRYTIQYVLYNILMYVCKHLFASNNGLFLDGYNSVGVTACVTCENIVIPIKVIWN